MVVTTAPDRVRWAGRLRLAVLVLVSLLVAHTTVYAAQYGVGDRYARAMSGAGHDGWWIAAGVVVLIGGLLVLLHVLGVLNRLEGADRTARVIPAGPDDAARPRFGPEVVAIWRRLLPLVTVLFVVQENIEHLASQGHLPGLDVLGGSEYPLALPILAIVTLALSALGAVIRWRIASLRAQVASAMAASRVRPVDQVAATGWRIVGDLAPRRWMAVRLDAGRAPPQAGS